MVSIKFKQYILAVMEDHAQENQLQYYYANYMHEIAKTPARNPSEIQN
jgi:hypothetical protein